MREKLTRPLSQFETDPLTNPAYEFRDGKVALKQEQPVKQRLEYLRGELRAERISYGELAELQSLVEHIAPDDVELLEAAGVPEQQPASQQPAGEHSPLPWAIDDDSPQDIASADTSRQYLIGCTFDHAEVSEKQAKANARLIVRAVNEREELLAIIRGLLVAYAPGADKTVAEYGEQYLHSSVARARAALHRAEQEGN